MNFALEVLSRERLDVYVMDSFVCTAILTESNAARRQTLRKVR